MSTITRFIKTAIEKADIDEFLKKRLKEAGYGGIEVAHTPLGTRITVHAMKPGLVIGRGGESVKELSKVLEKEFGLKNVDIAVAEVEVPELNPYIMATRIASALERGAHFRRVGFWALNNIMGAGALGAEICIKGKLRTERATYEKYRAGYLLKVGKPALKSLREAAVHVQLKPGIYGVKVRIMPPDSEVPDKFIQVVKEESKGVEKGANTAT
jgi:small subunit ribosomal protein S3